MQYVLTEEEYKALVDAKKKALQDVGSTLQNLCTMVADNLPITVYWSKEKEPWKCIHSMETEWYCDNCPVLEMCPSNKNWSK